MVTFRVSTKSYQTAVLNMVAVLIHDHDCSYRINYATPDIYQLLSMTMTALIEMIMLHLISTSYPLSVL